MKFMIMVFGDEKDLHSRPPEWAEDVTAFAAKLDNELAHTGELVYSEILEDGGGATVVDRRRRFHHGSITGRGFPLSRFWVVKVSSAERADEIAGSLAEVIGAAVEVRRVMEGSQRP
ncbi:YciI family protein [Homoserinimonas sp. A447]